MIIGMLGGSFCPPTNAHLELSKKCISEGLCDKVIWVPVNDAYKKETNISAKHRIEMVKLALAKEENIDYSLHEQDFEDVIYTIDSIKVLQSIHPDDKFLFIVGADKLKYKWMRREEFVRDFGFILVNRGDVDCNDVIVSSKNLSSWKENIKVLNFASDISSTVVRSEINDKGYSNYVSKEVMEYIVKNKLFL